MKARNLIVSFAFNQICIEVKFSVLTTGHWNAQWLCDAYQSTQFFILFPTVSNLYRSEPYNLRLLINKRSPFVFKLTNGGVPHSQGHDPWWQIRKNMRPCQQGSPTIEYVTGFCLEESCGNFARNGHCYRSLTNTEVWLSLHKISMPAYKVSALTVV